MEIVTQLRKFHFEGKKMAGIDVRKVHLFCLFIWAYVSQRSAAGTMECRIALSVWSVGMSERIRLRMKFEGQKSENFCALHFTQLQILTPDPQVYFQITP